MLIADTAGMADSHCTTGIFSIANMSCQVTSSKITSLVAPSVVVSPNKKAQTCTALLALLLVNRPASQLSNDSLLTAVYSQARHQEPTALFHTINSNNMSLS